MAHWISPWNHSLKCVRVCVCLCVRVCVDYCLCNSAETKTPQSVLLTIQVHIRTSTGRWKPDRSLLFWCWFTFFPRFSRASSTFAALPPPCGLLHLAGPHYLLCLRETLILFPHIHQVNVFQFRRCHPERLLASLRLNVCLVPVDQLKPCCRIIHS